MAINLTTADSALKTYYLDAVSEHLNNKLNPFFSKISKTTEHVFGKEVKKLAIYGINGGIGAGTEDGSLPAAKNNRYATMTSTLKNLYGTIEISDKAIRASENNAGAFVSLLNSEMEGLLSASAFNFGRMLFGDGSGVIAKVLEIEDGIVTLSDVRGIREGMMLDFRTAAGALISGADNREVLIVDAGSESIKISGTDLTLSAVPRNSLVTVHGSYGNEITGLGAIFDENATTLYGLDKYDNMWLNPYVINTSGTLTELNMLKVIDGVEEKSGDTPDLIVTSWDVRRKLFNVLSANKRVIDTQELEGGFKAITFNGIPVVVDRFCPKNTMYFLNTKDFALHQLCDWQWLEGEDGRILHQIPGKPVYTATLVKYAELMCGRPYAQGALTGITI